jgi:dTDP-4-amino-4,6-dideoxygalactose transaminase
MDAAAAVESQQIPRYGLVAHSLHATKPFGVGEGGLLVSRDFDAISRARQYTNFGMIDRICRANGSNTKMSEYHAAVGLAQLNRWGDVKQRRTLILETYQHHLRSLSGYMWLHPCVDVAVASCLMLHLGKPVAEQVAARGKEVGIGFHRTYLPPLYYHPYFNQLSLFDSNGSELPGSANDEQKRNHMSSSERLRAHLIGVPFHPFIDDSDVATVLGFLRTQLSREPDCTDVGRDATLCVAK